MNQNFQRYFFKFLSLAILANLTSCGSSSSSSSKELPTDPFSNRVIPREKHSLMTSIYREIEPNPARLVITPHTVL